MNYFMMIALMNSIVIINNTTININSSFLGSCTFIAFITYIINNIINLAACLIRNIKGAYKVGVALKDFFS